MTITSRILDSFRTSRKADNHKPLTLFLHIGIPKTGSSAIQNYLYEHRLSLQRFGLYYPDRALHWHQHVTLVKGIISPRFSQAGFNPLIPAVSIEEWLETETAGARSAGCTSFIISSEFFWATPAMQSPLEYHEDTTMNAEYLREAVDILRQTFSCFDAVKVIVYLRHQGSWLESFFNQQLKNGFQIPYEHELVSPRIYLLYYKNLQIWVDYFGKENVLVRAFEKTKGTLVQNFFSTVGLSPREIAQLPAQSDLLSNPGLTARGLTIMKEALVNGLERDTVQLLGSTLTRIAAALPPGPSRIKPTLFSQEFHDDISKAYRQDNQYLAELYPETTIFLEKLRVPESYIPQQLNELPGSWEEQVELLLEKLVLNNRKLPARSDPSS